MLRPRKLCGKHSKPPVIEAFLQDVGQPWRRAGPRAWGLSLDDVGGWPLHVGLAVRGPVPELLVVQAMVCGPGAVPAGDLLQRNRRLRVVRLACTRAGEVWVMGDLPWPVTDVAHLDHALGGLVTVTQDVRHAASRTHRSR